MSNRQTEKDIQSVNKIALNGMETGTSENAELENKRIKTTVKMRD